MKRLNREVNIFNLSMLDVMTGALGAVMIVMIVLLTQKIGVESMSCQELKEELLETSDKLAATTAEMRETKKELIKYKKFQPETAEKISGISKVLDVTAEKFTGAPPEPEPADDRFSESSMAAAQPSNQSAAPRTT